ncbi:MAG: Rsd/AlgQ family anti-sigma factor [Cycloclasticus sp.]|nr:MAG: Rsd/AlgQ family anti-sigma factor [Cycloclasticus sp.]
MTTDSPTHLNKRELTNYVIDQLIEERKQVWNLYCSVAGMESFKADKPIEELVEDFCQLSVDYISLGQFGLYQRILDGHERRKGIVEVAEKVYPRISESADAVLRFSERYQQLTPAKILNQLSDDLSTVGEQLAARFESEDELINQMRA